MSILALPNEIIKEIWKFVLQVEDIIRFGSTCKKIKSLSFEVESIILRNNQSTEVWKNILNQDLRHLRKLTVVHPLYRVNEPEKEKLGVIFNALTVLSTLQNLKSLELNLRPLISVKKSLWFDQLADLTQTIKKMTWLEDLNVVYDFTDDIGGFLINHTKLTQLRLSLFDGAGYDELTQLKSLRIPMHNDDDNEVLKQVLKLSNLTALDTNYSTIPLFEQISKLTNLEKLKSWKNFVALPKLTKLSVDLDDCMSEYHYELLNQMTLLTTLTINAAGLNPIHFSTLSNLQKLHSYGYGIDMEQSADFSVFKNLTYLKVSQIASFKLPQGLKLLSIPVLDADDEAIKSISDTNTIEHLLLQWQTEKSLTSITQLSRLTNLRSLNVTQSYPKGLCANLTGLATLRSLHIETFNKALIEEVQQLTQLCELTTDCLPSSLTLKSLRQQLPFLAVYHIHNN